MSFAAAAARGVPLAGIYNAHSVKQPSAQTQREVIMNTRDPFTVQSLRSMNASNFKTHVPRAIERSGFVVLTRRPGNDEVRAMRN